MSPDINLEKVPDNLSPVASPRTSTPQSPARRTIEDVWSDINVSILDHTNPNPKCKPFSMADTNLLDFMPEPATPTATTAAAVTPRRRNRRSRPRSTTPILTLNSTVPNHYTAFPPGFGNNKETAEQTEGDRRNQRLMKNRESAARSRARKQVYTAELEKEVNRLYRDNDRLRRRRRQLEALAAVAEQIPKKYGGLHRTLTSPF